MRRMRGDANPCNVVWHRIVTSSRQRLAARAQPRLVVACATAPDLAGQRTRVGVRLSARVSGVSWVAAADRARHTRTSRPRPEPTFRHRLPRWP